MLSPASRQMSTSRVASATPESPHALKNSFDPPNVPVPRLRTGTVNPDAPNNRYSMDVSRLIHHNGHNGHERAKPVGLGLCLLGVLRGYVTDSPDLRGFIPQRP